MPRVAFRLDFKTSELRSLDLPLEIRKQDATLMATALTSDTVDLRPGEYYATTRLPGGQRLVAPFALVDPPVDDPLVVVLAPDPEDSSAHEWEEISHFLGRSAAQDTVGPGFGGRRDVRLRESAGLPTALDDSPPAVDRVPHLCVYAGNVIRRTQTKQDPASIIVGTQADRDRLVQFDVAPRDQLLIAQLVQPGGPVQNMTLPVSAQGGLRLVVCRRTSGEYRLEAHLQNHAADMLLQYSGYGASTTATVASRSQAVDGERLLLDKMADPIAAAVGAYSILRLGSLERLHDWTAHLRMRFPWLPDGAAIHGEHLARIGKHGAAIEAFAEVPQRGLPLMADGLFYAVERLRLYACRTLSGQERVDPVRAQSLLDELQRFATLMRRQRPVSAFPGLDVGAPSTQPAPEGVPAPPSLDLATWFSPRV